MHGITITYENEVLAVTLPSLLPKRRQRQSAEFLLDPLYFALEQYAKENTLPHYRECVVCFAQVYDQALPTRRVRDYDNLEEKQILDLLSSFVMADDTMKVKNDTVAVEDGFKNIDLKEVPQSVKDAIAKKYPESTLKSASLSLKEEGVKAYRIIYVTKEGVENSILINIKTAPAKTAPATK